MYPHYDQITLNFSDAEVEYQLRAMAKAAKDDAFRTKHKPDYKRINPDGSRSTTLQRPRSCSRFSNYKPDPAQGHAQVRL